MILILVLIVILGLIFLFFLGGLGMVTSLVLGEAETLTTGDYMKCIERKVEEDPQAYVGAMMALKRGEADMVHSDESIRLRVLQQECRAEAKRIISRRRAGAR